MTSPPPPKPNAYDPRLKGSIMYLGDRAMTIHSILNTPGDDRKTGVFGWFLDSNFKKTREPHLFSKAESTFGVQETGNATTRAMSAALLNQPDDDEPEASSSSK